MSFNPGAPNAPIPRANLEGQVFGRLTVVEFSGSSPHKEGAIWRCACLCGEERLVTTKKLRAEKGVRSCGKCVKRRNGPQVGERAFVRPTPANPNPYGPAFSKSALDGLRAAFF